MKPRKIYRNVMRSKVNSKYLNSKNIIVLGENFVKDSYVLIAQTAEFGTKGITSLIIIIENIENPMVIEFTTKINQKGYITASKKRLKKQLPQWLYKFFILRGLNIDLETGWNGESDFLVSRLVACLYYNILGLEVHHWDYLPTENNYIWNLVPVEEEVHDYWKTLDRTEEHYLALAQEAKLKKKYFQGENGTKASNAVIKILKLKEDMYEEKQDS